LLKDDDAVKIETKEAKMKPYVIEMGRRGHIYIYIYIVNNVFQDCLSHCFQQLMRNRDKKCQERDTWRIDSFIFIFVLKL
jgi:hypothetical protein